jgi:hypothetical protein
MEKVVGAGSFEVLSGLVGKVVWSGNRRSYSCLRLEPSSHFLGLTLIKVLPNDKSCPVSFEVWLVRKDLGKFSNKWGLRFPSNEDFGYYAWSYQTETKALEKFNSLIKGGV